MEFEILSRFRDCPEPDLSYVREGVPLSTLKKEELIDVCGKKNLDVLNLCRIGNIDPTRENIVVITQHILNMAGNKRTAEDDTNKRPKKAKQAEFEALEKRIDQLQGELHEKRANDEKAEYDTLRRQIKFGSNIGVGVDEIFKKLLILEGIARKLDLPDKEQINMLIQRFQANKEEPDFAKALVLKMLSTKAEEVVLDKEQKLMKCFASKKEARLSKATREPNEKSTPSSSQPASPQHSFMPLSYGGPNMYPSMHMSPHPMHMPMHHVPPHGNPMRPRTPQRRRPYRPNVNMRCFKCNEVGHMVKDCLIN